MKKTAEKIFAAKQKTGGVIRQTLQGRCAAALKRVLCVALAAILVAEGLPMSLYEGVLKLGRVEAADGTKVTNAYIFEMTTGIHDGSAIEFFEIRYQGRDGVAHRQLLFPNEDSLYLGRSQVASMGSDVSVAETISDSYGYEAKYSWDKTGDGSALRQYSTDQFYFTTDVAIESIDRIDAFIGDNGTWTCPSMRLFAVDEVYGLRMAGVWSSDWYIDFSGTLIAEVTGGNSNWNRADANFLRLYQKAKFNTKFTDVDYGRHESQFNNHNYGFRFDFADRNGAGFECLVNEYTENKAGLLDMGIAEVFTLNITYTDVYGMTRFLRLPGSTGAAYWAYKNGISGAVLGLGQQGNSMAFTGVIPDCGSITDVTCTLGAAEAVDKANITVHDCKSSGITARRNSRAESSKTDTINLTCAAIYNMNQADIRPVTEGAMLNYDFSGKPILYQVAATVEGEKHNANATSALSMKSYNDKELIPKDNNEYYLVEIETDTMDSAGTKSDLNVVLKYIDLSKRERKSSTISVKEAVADYNGYWPASQPNFSYLCGMAPGSKVRFVMTLKDVDHFTGVNVSLESGSKDDYQFKNLRVYALTQLSKRKAEWRDISKSGANSRVEIYRDFEGDDSLIRILNLEEETLIQPEQVIPIEFESSKVGEITDTKWDLNKYSVSYADALQNYGFTKARKTYELEVNVFDDTVMTDDNGNVVSTGGNGDAGSENLFYFQLNFQNGASAYVLANQQLEGDRFRSGQAAYFEISTNQDYGEVTAIRIIPDDSSEDSKKYDKLRIDSIKVTEIASAGTHKCWIAENVGWIDIGYTEEQEKQGILGKKGRSASEIARTIPIDYTTYVAQLEFAIHTNEGEQATEDESGNPITPASQFRGKIMATINYLNLKGEPKELGPFDLVNAMYNYTNKKAPSIVGGAVSDPTIMFREKHTDRFLVNISDVSQLVSMDLDITQLDDPYTWNIGGVSAKIVTEKGKLKLNNYGEYEYQREKDEDLLCTQSSVSTPAYKPWLKKGKSEPLNIPFTEHQIKLSSEYGDSLSAITREPASQNDELNVFVFPSVGLGGNDVTEYALNAKLYYTHLNGKMYETDGYHMKKFIPNDGSRPVFYTMGLRASCMADLNRIILTADSDRANLAYMDYAIVQQVRSGVVVANYYIDLGNENVFQITQLEKFPSTNVTAVGYQDEQVLTFQFGEGTESKNLVADRQDVAVALRYKTAADPSGIEFTTPYIYLTDQQVARIRAGQVVDINFKQMFVGEVTGVKVAAIGSFESYVEAASVTTYQKDAAGTRTRSGFYSFGKGVAVSMGAVTMQQTADTYEDVQAVRSVELSFKTSAASGAYESGTNGPVWMRLWYETDENGNVDFTDKADLRKYLTDGSENFTTGQTQSVRFLVIGAQALRRVELEPKSTGSIGNAGWSLDSVTALLDDGSPVTRTVGERIYEDYPKSITLANITVAAQIYNYNESRSAYDEQRVQMEGAKLIASAGRAFRVTPYAYGSDRGCKVYAVEVTTNGFVGGELRDYMKSSGGSYSFTPPKLTKTRYYRIYVESVELPDTKLEIDLTVYGVSDGSTDGDDEE